MLRNYCLLYQRGDWYLFDAGWVLKQMKYPKHTYRIYGVSIDDKRHVQEKLVEIQKNLQSKKAIPTKKDQSMFPKLEELLKNKK